jgi:FkbM family methyltransferase
MISFVKRILFKLLTQRAYLKAMHRGFYFLFDLGLLKNDRRFKFHYIAKQLIKKDFTVIDIGANLGYFAKTFARLTPQGKVICIEPILPFYQILQKFLSHYPQVVIHNIALGEEEGIVEMVLPESSGMIRTGLPHIVDKSEDIGGQKTAQVKVKKGSELFGSLSKIDYIKCDIEGYEWIVFNELLPVISKCRPIIQVEISEANIDSLVEYFDKLAYNQYGICDFKIIREKGQQKEIGDFLFIPTEQKEAFETKFKLN